MAIKKFKILLLTALCLIGGFGFYKMNPHDPIVAGFFTLGLLGIMMSSVRKPKE